MNERDDCTEVPTGFTFIINDCTIRGSNGEDFIINGKRYVPEPDAPPRETSYGERVAKEVVVLNTEGRDVLIDDGRGNGYFACPLNLEQIRRILARALDAAHAQGAAEEREAILKVVTSVSERLTTPEGQTVAGWIGGEIRARGTK